MYQQNGLPYSATHVEESLIIPGLPQSVPPRNPPYGFPAPLMQSFQMIDGMLRAELQNKATANPMRAYLFNMMAAQGYTQRQYDDLLIGTATLMLYHFHTNVSSPNNIQHAIGIAVEVMCRIAASRNVRDYPALGQYVDMNDHNFVNDLNNNIALADQITNELKMFMQGGQQPPNNAGVTWNANMAQGNPHTGQNQVPQWQQQGSYYHTGGVQQRPQTGGMSTHTSSPMFQHGHSNYSNTNAAKPTGGGGFHDFERPTTATEEAKPTIDEVTFAPQEINIKVSQPQEEVIFDNEVKAAQRPVRAFDEFPEGYEVAPETQTNIVFNEQTHKRIFVLNAHGQVVEKIIPKGDNTMNYESHETEVPQVDAKSTAPVAKSAEWNNYHYDEGSIAVNPSITDDKVKVTVEDLVDAHSDEEAELILRKALHNQGIPLNDDNIFEFQYRQMKPIAVSKNCSSGQDLLEAKSLREFKDLLIACDLPERVVGKLNRRAVDILNEALMYKMSINWDIGSIEDIDDLITEIGNEYGESVLMRFTSNADKLVKLIFNALDAPTAVEYLIKRFDLSISDDGQALVENDVQVEASIERLDKDLPAELATETVEDEAYDVIVLADTISITQVPWTFEDMQLSFDQDDVAKLSSVANPVEYGIFQDLFTRTADLNVRHYYIDTQCGKRLKIHQGWISADYISIALV